MEQRQREAGECTEGTTSQAKEHRQPEKLGKAGEQIVPGILWDEHSPASLWILDFRCHRSERTNLCCLKSCLRQQESSPALPGLFSVTLT